MTQNISVILYAMLRIGWKCILNCVTWFLTLSNKVQKYLYIWFVCLSVRPSVHAVNILQMFLIFYMFFISDIEWTVLKMICMALSVRLERHTKVFRYISAYGGGGDLNFVKFIVTYLYCTKYNEIKYCIQLYKSMVRIQDHTKRFVIYYGLYWETVGYVF